MKKSDSTKTEPLLDEDTNAIPISGTTLRATPDDTNKIQVIQFYLEVSFKGGLIVLFDYELTIQCSMYTTGLSFSVTSFPGGNNNFWIQNGN